jgi:hypothetical protein
VYPATMSKGRDHWGVGCRAPGWMAQDQWLARGRLLAQYGRVMCALGGLGVGACGEGGQEGPGGTGGRASGSGGAAVGDGDGDSGAPGGQNGDGSGGRGGNNDACTVFPADSPWNEDVSALPVHDNSDNFIASIGEDDHVHPDFGTEWEGAPIGIPYVEVDASTPLTDVEYVAYGDESDPGPFPIPLDSPIEGGPDSDGDRHVIAWDRDDCMLYELYSAYPLDDHWEARSGAAYDLSINDDHPEGCTSADAAGLPVFPGLVRYDEVVEQGEITHALRFTVARSQRGYVYPARHYASSDTDPNLPPMGLRLRMKADYDCGEFSPEASVVCAALKTYGMIVADNGSNWYISGAPDPRWDDDALGDLKSIPGSAFEVVDTGEEIVTDAPDCVIE